MTSHLRRTGARLLATVVAAAALSGCNESVQRSASAPRAVVPRLALEISDSTAAVGSTIRVTVRARGVGLASATGRIAFDSTALAFAAEDSVGDGGTRVINPSAGVVRFAAIARDSFPDGVIHRIDLLVKGPNALRTLRVSLDEAHTAGQRDVTQSLRGTP